MSLWPHKNKFSFQEIQLGQKYSFQEEPEEEKTSRIKGMFEMITKKFQKNDDNGSSPKKLSKINSKIKKINKKNLLIAIAVFALIVLIVPKLFSSEGAREDSEQQSIKIKPAEASIELNKSFSFPLRDDDNEEVGKLEYEITRAEKLDEIVVQGKKATAVEGRTFLILNLKIKNDLNQSLEINTKDYVRLSVNGNTEDWLAPDIHNDPVKVQAISIKNTRIGFPINDSDENLILRVGEINGEKEEVPLEF